MQSQADSTGCGIRYECLPKGGGRSIVIFPQGAYVPNGYIDQAADSAGTWRAGSERERNCVLSVSSVSVQRDAEHEKYMEEVASHRRTRLARDEFETGYNLRGSQIIELTTKVGKRGTLVLALSLTTAALLATTAVLAAGQLATP